MTAPTIARLFRSPELRRLAGIAAAQGWTVDRLPGGHVAAVNPATGARVLMSGTGYVNRGTLKAKVHEFVVAGLDPDWSRKAARAARRHRQEVPMQVRQVDPITPAVVIPTDTREVVRHPNAAQPAGGKFALVGSLEVLDVGGFEVKVGERQDGTWMAYTRDLGLRARRRTWYARTREAVVARATVDVVERPPKLDPVPVAEVLPEVVQEVVARQPSGESWHVVHATPAEYPLAAALDRLEVTVAPAVEALRAAGKPDAADLLVAEATPGTPLERELLALYRRVMRGD